MPLTAEKVDLLCRVGPDSRAEDTSVQRVKGKLRTYHRHTERFVQADSALVRFGHLILESVKREEVGMTLLGLENFDYTTIQSAPGVIGPDDRWQDLVAANRGVSRQGAGVD